MQPGALVLVSCLAPGLLSPGNPGEIDPSSPPAFLAHGTSADKQKYKIKSNQIKSNQIVLIIE